MINKRYELDTRVLAVFFLAAMPFVALGSFLVVSMARSELRSSVGTSLDQRALQTKIGVERYVADQVVHLRLLATDPLIVQALSRQSPAPAADDLRKLEQAWATGQDPRLFRSILEAPVSVRLRQVVGVRPALKTLQVVGVQGLVVAAAARTSRFQHSDAPWWKALAGQAEDVSEPWVGEIQRGAGSTSTVLEIAYPVRSAGGEWLGAVRGLVDGTDLYAVLAPVRIGRTGHAVLVRSTDGMVLAADESERVLTQPLPGWTSLQSAIEGFPLAEHGQALFGKTDLRRGYWSIPEVTGKTESGREGVVEPARLVGFAPVDQVPNVKWLVTVEQDLNEALAPVEGVTRYLWIHFVGVFAAVILLALWFSFKLETPVMEEELHMHEEHVPSSMRPSAT
jgi:hypothetical protein